MSEQEAGRILDEDPQDEKERRPVLGLILLFILVVLCSAGGVIAASEGLLPIRRPDPTATSTNTSIAPTDTSVPDTDTPAPTETDPPTLTEVPSATPTDKPTLTLRPETRRPSATPTKEPTATATEPQTCNIRTSCGDGKCDPTCENTDLCPRDCNCVDNGVCERENGEGSNCADCRPGGACGVPCPTGQCSGGLSCLNGVCWDNAICGGGATVTAVCSCTEVCIRVDVNTQQCLEYGYRDCNGLTCKP